MMPEEEALEKNLERNRSQPFYVCGSNYSELQEKVVYTKWFLWPDKKETYYPIRHRQIRKDEVVFDVDSGNIPQIADRIRAMLALKYISYEDYLTGSKKCGRHIHCSFPELISYPQRFREILKKEILLHFSCHWEVYEDSIDKLKVSDKCLIRLEDSEHEITKVPKSLLHEYKSPTQEESIIPQKIIDEVLTSIKFKKNKINFPTTKEVPYWIFKILEDPEANHINRFNAARFLIFNMRLGKANTFEIIKKYNRWSDFSEKETKYYLKSLKYPLSQFKEAMYNGKPKL